MCVRAHATNARSGSCKLRPASVSWYSTRGGISDHLRGVFEAAARDLGDQQLSLAKITAEPHPPMPVLAQHRPGHARSRSGPVAD